MSEMPKLNEMQAMAMRHVASGLFEAVDGRTARALKNRELLRDAAEKTKKAGRPWVITPLGRRYLKVQGAV